MAGEAAAKVQVVGVIGAGQMGSGIAQLAAVAGIDVWLQDTDRAALDRAGDAISDSIRRLASKGQIPQSGISEALNRLRFTLELNDLRSADVVIEAIVESEDAKRKLFSELDKITKASCILASNTSSISITRLASQTQRPSQVCLLHAFYEPPAIMKLVEIIRGTQTSDEVFATAFYALYTGIATREDIDMGMKLGTNQPMGPLQLADFIGLDICLSAMKTLHGGLGGDRYSPCPLLIHYVDAGWLGKKREGVSIPTLTRG
ncbi:unnamed protein product [Spirodela intermedia]|uniref:3-hydroxyacyl-CoA dehydrogenase NAD binding domain-containing protein n=1 Tax=Spirodela intermedia TaxID=51605 RepID=A0A7I8IG42_SPIIN|nr:unnamed protein product [Spirodela intermedia]CAA6656601.1 unnamed protein product [Spirodela intermedia]